ncbi:MAG: gliding motility protein GldM [Cyclobacteriaceae bacterium]|nr:gliding motility protein GldM [Cyclobacteriaceae bacterium]
MAPKETPRQKMIGMMYLVLTAMLALNVDSAVLERFELINGTLEEQIKNNGQRNGLTVKSIAAMVEEKGNRKDDVAVLKKAQEVRQKTDVIISYMNKLKAEIIEDSGGKDEDGKLVGAKNMEKIAIYMIRYKRGDSLKTKLNGYTTWLSNALGKEFASVALDGKEDPYWSKIPNQRKKNFSELMFESVPTAGGLASMSQLEGRLLDYEEVALNVLSQSVGAKDISFDKIVPMVLPESQLVAAGAKYKAKMFISASATGITPAMKLNGSSIPVDSEGFGTVEFTAKADKYDANGQQRKTFTAEIAIGEQTFKEQISYIVARPVIQIQSASVQALYRNCGNKLDVQVPALGAAYNPSFRVKGGSSQGGRGGKITIVPTSPTVELSVYSSGTFIGKQKFRAKPIPKPELVLKSGGNEIDLKRGVSKIPREITLQAVPDADFAQFLPDDANYRVTKWEVTLARQQRAIETKQVTSTKANLASFVSKARPGDRIVIEAKEVQRMNFKKEKENVRIGVNSSIKTVPIN